MCAACEKQAIMYYTKSAFGQRRIPSFYFFLTNTLCNITGKRFYLNRKILHQIAIELSRISRVTMAL